MLGRVNRVITSLSLCVGVCVGSTAFAEDSSESVISQVYRGIPHDALYDVCFKGENGLSVGAAGVLLTSSDSGLSWQIEEPTNDLALLGVTCRGSNTIVVGQAGHAQRRTDGGDWQVLSTGTKERLMSVSANDSGLTFIVGGFGVVLRSQDAGVTWQPVTLDWEGILNDFIEPHIYDVTVFDDNTVIMVGEFELVLLSTDGGDTWETMNKGDSSLSGIHFRDRQNGYAVGQDGRVIKTVDGGLNWQRLEVPSRENLLDVWSNSKGRVAVVGIRTLLRSQDDGLNWESVTEDDIPVRWYQAVEGAPLGATGEDNVVMVGHSGRIVQIK